MKYQKTHGDATHDRRVPEYVAWHSMRSRCHNPTHKKYKDYGARGIIVCDKWRNDYQAFLKDMGRKPSPAHSLDRIDNNKGYEPGNVRWATAIQQHQNTRANRLLTINGETKCVTEWARIKGFEAVTIHHRMTAGWPIEKLFVPLLHSSTRKTKA